MSGTAALSAARKRRATTTPTPMNSMNTGNQSQYYSSGGGVANNSRQSMPQSGTSVVGGVVPGANVTIAPPPNMSIHENIALIRAQMAQRQNIITTQGRTMPPERLKMLQSQQEVQNKILLQKIELARVMEAEELNQADSEGPHFPTQTYNAKSAPATQTTTSKSQATTSGSNRVEPKFILEKGVPRINPKYVEPSVSNTGSSISQSKAQQQAALNYKNEQQQQQLYSKATMPTATLTPFVSMISSNGAIPPPIVILKSHDEKIGEHDAVLNDLSNRMNYMNSRIDQLNVSSSITVQRASSSASEHNSSADSGKHTNNKEVVENGQEGEGDGEGDGDGEGEPVLLMEEVIEDLLNSREFMHGVVDKIMNETNLADVIYKVEPIIKENQELRSLIHSQQEMLNKMNTLLLTFMNDYERTKQEHNSDHSNGNVASESNVDSNEYANDEGNFDSNGLCDDFNGDESMRYDDNYGNESNVECETLTIVSDSITQEDATSVHYETVEDVNEQADASAEVEARAEVEASAEVEAEASTDVEVADENDQPQPDTQESNEQTHIDTEEYEEDSAPSFPDMDRVKLLVSEIVVSDE